MSNCQLSSDVCTGLTDKIMEDTIDASDSKISFLAQRTAKIPSKTLIQMVKKRPVLWDPKVRKTCLAREEAWREVFQALVPSFDSLSGTHRTVIANRITKRWTNIRDHYKKSMRRGKAKTYYISHLLSFLDPIYANDNPSNSEEIFETPELTQDCKENSESETERTEVYTEPEFEMANVNPEMQTEDVQANDDKDINMIGVLSNLIAREQDEDRAFFNSLIPTVRMLPRNVKMEFRIELMQLLQRCTEKIDKKNLMCFM